MVTVLGGEDVIKTCDVFSDVRMHIVDRHESGKVIRKFQKKKLLKVCFSALHYVFKRYEDTGHVKKIRLGQFDPK